VAVIGAAPLHGSVDALVARNVRRAGFARELTLVNPQRHAIDGLPVYPNVVSLPRTPISLLSPLSPRPHLL
jgi:acetyltransferase